MNPTPKSPKNQPLVTLISGYRGLAESLIKSFDEAGHHLSVLVRRESAAPSLQRRFPRLHTHIGDVTSQPDCDAWVAGSLERWGRIDCVINNAAIPGPGGRLDEVAWGDFEQTLRTNYLAPAYLCHRILPQFLVQGSGVIINLSGGGATQGRPYFTAYATSKCALVRLTESLALEYAQFRFYAIAPGALVTPMIESILKLDPDRIGGEYAEFTRRVEEGGDDPNRAAHLCLWLAETKPAHLNGRLIAAVWDDYKEAPTFPDKIGWWTLRRVDDECRKRLMTITSSGEKH